MTLAPDFQFSQNSLQDYVDCARRFQLRYVLRQPWPAVAAEPVDEYELLMDRARRFHELAQRHNLGLPEASLAKSIDDDDLRRWWRHYLESPPPDLPPRRQPEVTLSAPVGDFRLVAKYDLLAIKPGQRAVIVDWKTSRKRPDPDALAQRLQTRVYRYILVSAGLTLNGGVPLAPHQVSMIYWFTEHPAQPVILPYDEALFGRDAADLADLMARVAAYAQEGVEEWPLTPDERQCRYCTYRSLCDRGVLPGPLAEFDADQSLDISFEFEFEDVEEIEY